MRYNQDAEIEKLLSAVRSYLYRTRRSRSSSDRFLVGVDLDYCFGRQSSGPHRLTLVRLLYVGDLIGHLPKRRDGSLLILGKLLGERQAACIGTCQPPKGYGAAKAKLQALGHVFERARSEAGFEEG